MEKEPNPHSIEPSSCGNLTLRSATKHHSAQSVLSKLPPTYMSLRAFGRPSTRWYSVQLPERKITVCSFQGLLLRKQVARIPRISIKDEYAARESRIGIAHHSSSCLDLLGTPAGIGLAHIARGLDRRDELEDDIADADASDDGTRDVLDCPAAQNKAAKEDVQETTPNE